MYLQFLELSTKPAFAKAAFDTVRQDCSTALLQGKRLLDASTDLTERAPVQNLNSLNRSVPPGRAIQ